MGNSPRRRAAHQQQSAGGATPQAAPASLGRQVTRVKRHPLILLSGVILGAAALGGYSALQPANYEAKATVLAYALSTDPTAVSTANLRVDISTEAAVAESREVAEQAVQELSLSGDDEIQKIMGAVKVSGHSQTSILDIKAQGKTPEIAAQRANAVAEAYLTIRSSVAQADRQDTIEAVNQNIKALSSNAETNRATITALRDELARLQVSSTKAGRIISSAQEPSEPEGLSTPLYAGVGAVAGTLLAIPLAYLYDRRRRTLGYVDRAEEIMGSPVTAIPRNQLTTELPLLLRRAGLSQLAHTTPDYRGIAFYTPARHEHPQLLAAVENIAQHTPNLTPTTDTRAALESPSPTLCLLDPTADLLEILTLAEHLGYGVLAFTKDTPIATVHRIHRETGASSASFIPLFIH